MPVTEGVLKNIITRLLKIFIVFSLIAVFNSFLQVFVILQSQEIKKFQSEIKLLEKDISRIKVEVASLGSFDRIQSIALNELGMRAADTNDYHWVEALPIVNTPIRKENLQDVAKDDFKGQMFQWMENVGKTMAQSL